MPPAAHAPVTFFWHDYETFGRNPRADWPAQFAGIRTDAELNEIGEPVMHHCQPPTDRLPEPEACLLTGILPQHAQAHGLAPHAFAAAVERALGEPGTIGVGYNSIRFDDEVTRHLFWRNLIEPYGREWRNGCSRWDLLDVVRCFWALRPDHLQWPEVDGRPSFKLEHLAAANGLAHEAAHDALSDVRATIALARALRAANLRLWDFCLALRHKDAVWQQVGLGAPRPFLHISGMFGTERGCMAVVWPLGMHPTNRNELIVWDLAAHPGELQGLDVPTLRQRLFTRADALPEGVGRLPVKTIHVNKSPIVIGQLKTLPPERAEHFGIDLAQCLAHAEAAAAMPPVPAETWAQVFERPAPAEPPDVEEDLYGGFIGDEDRRALDRLRQQPPAALAGRMPHFNDARLDELVWRWRARNHPQTLDADDHARWQAHCAERLHGGTGGGLTLADYLERIDTLSETADERGQDILGALVDWAEAIAPEAP